MVTQLILLLTVALKDAASAQISSRRENLLAGAACPRSRALGKMCGTGVLLWKAKPPTGTACLPPAGTAEYQTYRHPAAHSSLLDRKLKS